MNDFPHILLLTPGAIDFPFGSGEMLRKIVLAMPEGAVHWASLRNGKVNEAANAGSCRVFPFEPAVHWRVRRGLIGSLFLKELWARRRARRIAEWAVAFEPDLLWVLAEEDAVSVGCHLQRALGIPTHITVHDAPEIITTQFGQFHFLVRKLYMRRLRQLVLRAGSIDGVCDELTTHVLRLAGGAGGKRSMTFPFSLQPVNSSEVSSPEGAVRKIGFCGSLRTSRRQWEEFLMAISALPFQFELLAFVDRDYFPEVKLPSNVAIRRLDFAVTEDIVKFFKDQQVSACYLGLYREPEWELFCRTSLSSKLTTYAATGVPVIVNGPADSAVWRYVEKYKAGVLFEDDERGHVALKGLFCDAGAWSSMAKGARRLFDEEFDMTKNIERFKECLLQTSRRQ